jgi:hypothetical protein
MNTVEREYRGQAKKETGIELYILHWVANYAEMMSNKSVQGNENL